MTLALLIEEVQRERATRGISLPALKTSEVFEHLNRRQYTGQLVLHCRHGKIVEIEMPNPIKIRVE